MYANRRKLPNIGRPRIVVSDVKSTQYHFKNEACRRAALASIDPKHHPRNAHETNMLVRDKRIAMKLVDPVRLKIATFLRLPIKPGKPRLPQPVILGIKRSAEEFAAFVTELAQLFPRGFRQPSARPDRSESTSLVEQAAIRAGTMEPNERERSKRGMKKLEADEAMKKAIAAERENGIDPKYLHAHARRRLQPQETELREAA